MTAARVQPPTTLPVSPAAPSQTRADRADLHRLTGLWTALVRLTVVAQAHGLGDIPTVPGRVEVIERQLLGRHPKALAALYAWQATYIHTGTGRPESCPTCWAVRTDPAPTTGPTLTVVGAAGARR